jgi:uncharacterized membrane protein (UPF0127 family)
LIMSFHQVRAGQLPRALLFLLLCLELGFAQVGCGQSDARLAQGKLETIKLEIGGVTFTVEVARTAEEKQKGLMYRKKLGRRQGMLFPYPVDTPMRFWMANTQIPLSIAFIDRDGVIVQIEDLEPFDLESVRSRISVRYALEVNQGVFEELGVQVGDVIAIPEGL